MMYVYILTNIHHTILYIGVTNNLDRRFFEHQTKQNPKSFTARYNLTKLVYYQSCEDPQVAIYYEKQLKNRSRPYKIALITRHNPTWSNLMEGIA